MTGFPARLCFERLVLFIAEQQTQMVRKNIIQHSFPFGELFFCACGKSDDRRRNR